MNLNTFIYQINSSLPDIDAIINAFKVRDEKFDILQAQKYLSVNTIRLNHSISPYQNEIENLIINTNVSQIGIGAINFRSKLKRIDDHNQHFASYNDFYKICYSIKNEEILSVSGNGDVLTISNSINQFLDFLIFYNKWDKNLVFKMKNSEAEINNNFRVLKNDGFSIFWLNELVGQ